MKIFVTTLLAILSLELNAAEPDYTQYDKILKKYTYYGTKGGIHGVLVQYTKLRKEPQWKEIVKMIESYDTKKLSNYRERAAFFINAYNVHTINAIIKKPTLSIAKIKDVFKLRTRRVGGRLYSLDAIEKKVKTHVDARFHFAVVCAAISCPNLRRKAYRSRGLYWNFNAQTKRFLRNAAKGIKVNPANKTVSLSKIFDWYKKDFDKRGGVMKFVRKYNKKVPKDYKPVFDIKYDWSLNGY